MGRKKAKRKEVKNIKTYLKDRFDCDYENKLDNVAYKWFRKFIEEYYGQKFTDKMIHKKDQKSELYKLNNDAASDVMNVLVRVNIESYEFDGLKMNNIREVIPREKVQYIAEIDREYLENGIKITRYKTIKKKTES